MDYALELFFDSESEARVRSYWQAVDSSLPRLQSTPHVTIGCFSDSPLEQANEALRCAAEDIAPFPLCFAALGMFTTPEHVLYLAPIVTQELLNLHTRLHEAFAFCDSANFWYYHPGNWVPHCTISAAQNAEELARAAQVLAREHRPFTAQVTRLAWVEITKPIKIAGCFEL